MLLLTTATLSAKRKHVTAFRPSPLQRCDARQRTKAVHSSYVLNRLCSCACSQMTDSSPHSILHSNCLRLAITQVIWALQVIGTEADIYQLHLHQMSSS